MTLMIWGLWGLVSKFFASLGSCRLLRESLAFVTWGDTGWRQRWGDAIADQGAPGVSRGWKGPGAGSPPIETGRRCAPADHPRPGLQTSCPQNPEKIHFCSSRAPSLWDFMRAPLGDEHCVEALGRAGTLGHISGSPRSAHYLASCSLRGPGRGAVMKKEPGVGTREDTEEGQPPRTSALGHSSPGHWWDQPQRGHPCPEEVRGQPVDHRPLWGAVKTGHVPLHVSPLHMRRKRLCGQSPSGNRM